MESSQRQVGHVESSHVESVTLNSRVLSLSGSKGQRAFRASLIFEVITETSDCDIKKFNYDEESLWAFGTT